MSILELGSDLDFATTSSRGVAEDRRSPGYQVLLISLLSLNFGIVFFDRNAMSFLMPFIQGELRLTNTQIGITTGALSLTWALASFGVARLSDRTGRRTSILVAATLIFSLCSFISGVATSFVTLLGARLLMGVAEGGILPISQSLVAREISPRKRGLAMGVMQNFGSNLLGGFAAPILLIAFAEFGGWRHAFFLAGIPGLVSAALIIWLIREPNVHAPVDQRGQHALGIRQSFAHKNIRVCAVIAALLVSFVVICWVFMPLYLVHIRGFTAKQMGILMGILGLSAAAGSIIVPGLSDRVGRRPTVIWFPFLAAVLPLSALFFHSSVWVLGSVFFVGWAVTGVFPLFMATIPSETTDARHIASVIGFVMGIGELVGGVGGPWLAGIAADRVGLAAPLWIMLGLCISAGLLGFLLDETAPNFRSRPKPSVHGR